MSRELKHKVQSLVTSLTKRINKEKDEDKRYRMKIIKQELSKLADEL